MLHRVSSGCVYMGLYEGYIGGMHGVCIKGLYNVFYRAVYRVYIWVLHES